MDAYYDMIRWLPPELSAPMQRLEEEKAQTVTEVRLRSNRPLCCIGAGRTDILFSSRGPVTASAQDSWTLSHEMINRCFLALCRYSVHSQARALENGYLTLPGGHRVGVGGSAFYPEPGRLTVQNITSLNIRIARKEVLRLSPKFCRALRDMKSGMIVAGEPGSGKTTLLRAAVQVLSDINWQTAVVDERGELFPVGSTGFAFLPPGRCDVLSGYPKHIGMQHALRGLGPDVIVCDEVGDLNDVTAIEQAANAGVRLLVSIHAKDMIGLMRRPQYQALLKTGAFDSVVFLEGHLAPGRIREVCNVSSGI